MTDKLPVPAPTALVPAAAQARGIVPRRAQVVPALLAPAAKGTLTRVSRSHRVDLAERLATLPKNGHVGRHIDIQV